MTKQSLGIAYRSIRNKIQNPGSLIGSSFNLMLGQGIGFVALFAMDLWLIRELSRTDFGTWKQFIWIIRFVIPFMFFGFPDSYRYFSAIDTQNARRHFVNIFMILVSIGLFFQILYFTNALEVIELITKNSEFKKILFYIPLLLVLSAIKFLSRIHAIFIKKTNSVVMANLIFSLILILGLYLFINQGKDTILVVLFSWIMAESIRVLYYFIANNLFPTLRFSDLNLSKAVIFKYIKYGIPYYISTTIFLIFMNVDKTMVSIFSGVESFAVFSIAAVEIPFLPSVFISVAQSMFPRLADLWTKNPDEAFKLWFSAFKKVSYLIFPIIIILLWIARPLFVFAYTESYIDGLSVFRVYLLLLIWRTASYSILLNAGGKPQLSMWLNGLFLVVNIILSYILYSYFGILGVVWATLISFSLLNLSILWSLKKLKRFITLVASEKKMLILIFLIVGSYILSNMYA